MKKLLCFFLVLGFVNHVAAQDYKWAFGFYGDVQLKSSSNVGSFGVQGKYDLDNRSSVQALVNGRTGFVSVGADYLFSVLDKTKSNFNVFLGVGVSQDFYRYNENWKDNEKVKEGNKKEENIILDKRDNFTQLNGQVGASYYFPEVQLSVFAGYKVKYNTKSEEFNPNFLQFGVRYHLW